MLAMGLVVAAVAEEVPLPPSVKDLPLRSWAQRRDVQFGVAIDDLPLREDARYRALVAREFSMLTPANAMKMGPLQPERDQFAWGRADAQVEFAEANAQRVHGHALVWHQQLPRWLESRHWTRQELLAALRGHVSALVGRYKGRVQMWDVVNEAFEDDGSRRQSLWQKVIGPDYIEQTFRMAHAIDPVAVLLYNDYNGEGLGKKSDAIYAMLRDFKTRGVPVHGVGLQMHMTVGKIPPAQDFRANLQRLAGLGLELHVTEADVRIPLPATEADFAEQARNYRQLLTIALEFPAFRSWTLWGCSDRHSWVPHTFKGFGAALPWDEHYQAKPAREALGDALRGNFRSHPAP